MKQFFILFFTLSFHVISAQNISETEKKWNQLLLENNKEPFYTELQNHLNAEGTKSDFDLVYFLHVLNQSGNLDSDKVLHNLSEKGTLYFTNAIKLLELYDNESLYSVTENFSFSDALLLGPYATNRFIRAYNQIDHTKSIKLFDRAIAMFPDNYSILNLGANLLLNYHFADSLRIRVHNNAYPSITTTFFKEYLQNKEFGRNIRVKAHQFYLSHFPENSYAAYVCLDQLFLLEQFEEAQNISQKFLDIAPFHRGIMLEYLKNLARYNNHELLVSTALQYNNRVQAKESPYLLIAQAYYDEGHYGNCQKHIDKIDVNQQTHRVRYLKGQLNENYKLYEKALMDYRFCLDQMPHNMIYLEQYFKQLAQVSPADAISFFHSTLNKHLKKRGIIALANSFFRDHNEFNIALNICKDATNLLPSSSWMWNILAQNQSSLGHDNEALASLQRSFDTYKPSSWTVKQYVRAFSEINTTEETKAEVNRLLQIYPFNESLWDALADLKTNTEEKQKVWEQAEELNSELLFPLMKQSNLLTNAGRWEEAVNIFEGKDDRLLETELAGYNFQKAFIFILKSRRHNLNEDEIAFTQKHLKDYLEHNGAYIGAYHQFMTELFEATNDKKKAAFHAKEFLKIRPSTKFMYWKLATDLASEVSNIFVIYRQLLDRNPYDSDVFHNLINLEVRWSGSPINGYFLCQEFKQRFPDKVSDILNSERSALSALGDNISEYADGYIKSGVIGRSKRYVNWLHTARTQAMNRSSSIAFDPETNSAKILLPDGTMAERFDDPVFSKIKKIKIGENFVSADYNDNGNLTNLKSSNGNFVQLFYNSDQKITEIITDKENMLFEYDPTGKLSMISIKDMGSITVTYKEDGEIDQVFSDEGTQMAMRVTGTFQELLNLTRVFEQARSLARAELPNLGFEDVTWAELHREFNDLINKKNQNARTESNYFNHALNMAKYLFQNIHTHPDYSKQCLELISTLSNELLADNNRSHNHITIETLNLYYDALLKLRRYGVSLSYWNHWVHTQEQINSEINNNQNSKKYVRNLTQFQLRVAKEPIRLLAFDEWLPKADIQNKSYWKNIPVSDVIPALLFQNNEIVAMHYLQNGELLVVTQKALIKREAGYWQAFQFNLLKNQFEEYKPNTDAQPPFLIHSFCSTQQGQLMIGTSSGIIQIHENNIAGNATRTSIIDGLPASNIDGIEVINNTLYIKSHNEVWRKNNTWEQLDFNKEKLHFFKKLDDGKIWVLSNKGIYHLSNETELKPSKVFDERRDEIICSNNTLYTRKGVDIFKFYRHEQTGNYIEFRMLNHVVTTNNSRVLGMQNMYVNNQLVLGIQTDLGISFLKEGHFEHFYIDLIGKPAVYQSASHINESFFYTSTGFYHFSKKEVFHRLGDARQVLYNPKFDKTWVILDSYIHEVKEEKGAFRFRRLNLGYGNFSKMCLDQNGDLIVSNGLDIERVLFNEQGELEDVESLFYAEAKGMGGNSSNEVNDIMVDSKGILWVVTDFSVFMFEDLDDENILLDEFNFFDNPERFPSYTHYVYSVYEDLAGDIYVVCSDEGHIRRNNQAMKGGLLRFNPTQTYTSNSEEPIIGGFDRVETQNLNYNWFSYNYTVIDDNTAIIATNNGFAKDENNKKTMFTILNDPSYLKLREDYSALYLGTKGANLGDLWLFGTESGVVGYYNDIWFYPENLNALLPDDIEIGKYGGRAIRSITTDTEGRVYIATYRGLLIYDSGNEDGTGLFIDNNMPNLAIQAVNATMIQKENAVIIEDLKENSSSGKLIAEIESNKEKLTSLKKSEGELHLSQRSINRDSLNREIQQIQRRQAEILLTLEQSEPAVFQALTLPPLDIQSSRNMMNDNEVVVQYIPMSKKLFINIVSKEKTLLKEVPVISDTIENWAKVVLPILHQGVNKRGATRINQGIREVEQDSLLNENLQKLYNALLKPVYNEIAKFDNVLIVPSKFLHYLPMSALCYLDENNKTKYAIEDHNIGYVTSMYLFNLVYNFRSNSNANSLVIADPDGSLPGALREGQEIAKTKSGNILLVGNRANLSNFKNRTKDVSSIHFATHGLLDAKSIQNSWLLFADTKLKMTDVYGFDFNHINFVVLSACETALGAEGLEYAHLARAFANAGVPSIAATLWAVNDDASKTLMLDFYDNISNGMDKFSALANAQRKMIQSEDKNLKSPSMWAPYIIIGKP